MGLFDICSTPLVAFQSEFTCAAGIVGLFLIKSRELVVDWFQSDCICAAGIVGLSDRSL